MLIKLVKLFNVDIVERVLGAKLVDLMVDLVVDHDLIVADRVVLHGLPDQIFLNAIHHFNLVKLN